MDTITAAALSVDFPLLRAIGLLLDNALVFAGIILLLTALGEERGGKRRKVILSVILAVAAAYAIKLVMAMERPCVGQEWCPGDYSFPSMHASAAFALMCGFLNRKSFPLYLIFALFSAFTRLNLGVHVFPDVAAALPIALVSYYLVDLGEKNG